MGEIADWINDQLYDPFIDGTPEYFLDPCADDGPAGLSCRYCNAGPLWWIEVEQGYRLADEQGQVHSCEQYQRRAGKE